MINISVTVSYELYFLIPIMIHFETMSDIKIEWWNKNSA